MEFPEQQNLDPRSIITLFSGLEEVYFFMKDIQGRFIGANKLQLKKLGLHSEKELIGKTDLDFFPKHMVHHYLKDDRKVIKTGKPIHRRIELVANCDGSASWQVTTKHPLNNKYGICVGIIGYMLDLEEGNQNRIFYSKMNNVIQYIHKNFNQPIELSDLAQHANLSISQFSRRFSEVFDQSPIRFLIQYRVHKASHIIIKADYSISEIALKVGFYDHSHFSREFKKIFTMSPGSYRKFHLKKS